MLRTAAKLQLGPPHQHKRPWGPASFRKPPTDSYPELSLLKGDIHGLAVFGGQSHLHVLLP
jgi:hypothetical protein